MIFNDLRIFLSYSCLVYIYIYIFVIYIELQGMNYIISPEEDGLSGVPVPF